MMLDAELFLLELLALTLAALVLIAAFCYARKTARWLRRHCGRARLGLRAVWHERIRRPALRDMASLHPDRDVKLSRDEFTRLAGMAEALRYADAPEPAYDKRRLQP